MNKHSKKRQKRRAAKAKVRWAEAMLNPLPKLTEEERSLSGMFDNIPALRKITIGDMPKIEYISGWFYPTQLEK